MDTENGFGEDPRAPKVYVHLYKEDGSVVSNALQTHEDETQIWQETGALPPPFDQRVLTSLLEHSNSLRQNIDAYATNVDGFGHSFTPIVDLEADDTQDHVRSVMMVTQELSGKTATEPSAAEVDVFTQKLAAEQRMELLKLEAFFENCSDASFPELRSITRQDVENTGNGYWEVLRNGAGFVSRFNYVEAWTVRLLPLDTENVPVKVVRRQADLEFETVTETKRFRRFVQRVGNKFVYFKEFGDTRTVSAVTGKPYASPADMLKAEGGGDRPVVAATELVHFKVHSSRSAYGIPRWIGNLLSVMGSRQCEEVNFAYFENKSVPPLAVLVNGGRLSKDTSARLQDYIKNEIRGKDNFHKILVIEAESSNSTTLFENSGQTKIELKPLVEAQTSDALFQNYDERNIDKVGMAFRLPRMLRGDTRDFNRSCYSEDTQTLTENGWKLWHEVAKGEKIAAFHPDDTVVTFVEPAALLVYDVISEPMFEINTERSNCRVTRDHTMLITQDGYCENTILLSQDLPDRFSVPVSVDGLQCAGNDLVIRGESLTESVYTGKVYCFSVPGYGFFVTRRNGKVALQGNTSYAALDFAERQVFEPLRQRFDYWVNRHILLPRKIKHWRYKSNGPMLRDPEALSKMIHDLGDVLTPNTALELAQDVFGRRFGRITEEWGDRPLKLTIADIATQNNVAGGPDTSGSPAADDANPDNQSPSDEPTQTNAISDNKGQKGKTADQPRNGGRFGAKGPKAPPKRPKVKKAAAEAVAEHLSALADVLEASAVEESVERIQAARTAKDE